MTAIQVIVVNSKTCSLLNKKRRESQVSKIGMPQGVGEAPAMHELEVCCSAKRNQGSWRQRVKSTCMCARTGRPGKESAIEFVGEAIHPEGWGNGIRSKQAELLKEKSGTFITFSQ